MHANFEICCRCMPHTACPSALGGMPRPPLCLRRSKRRPLASKSLIHSADGCTGRCSQIAYANKRTPTKSGEVSYGKDWYKQTRENSRRFKTVKEELEWRRKANLEANNGRDRKDLYTDNWDGDKWKGSGLNILTVILLVSVLVPLAGLWFAYSTFGTLWG